MNFFEKVYEVVCQIPAGKVMTYGQVARIVGTKDARRVGYALHANRDPKIPCHRVVNKDGRLSLGYVFGGPKEQKNRLIMEGVKFATKNNIDLNRYQYHPLNT
jgi:methylated-DNA-protein-cysteine methyltransferase-like protein